MPDLKFQMAVAIAERIVAERLEPWCPVTEGFLHNKNFWSGQAVECWERDSPAWKYLSKYMPEIRKELDARKD